MFNVSLISLASRRTDVAYPARDCFIRMSDWVRPWINREILTGYREEGHQLVFSQEVPGVDPKNLQVTVEPGRLTIRGIRYEQVTPSGKERMTRIFERSFSLPSGADCDRAEATARHGILTVTIPKKGDARSRRIEIGGKNHDVDTAATARETAYLPRMKKWQEQWNGWMKQTRAWLTERFGMRIPVAKTTPCVGQ
ncbi:MAG: Hsp20/alpha crystallin family protein [Magnetococcales bacterium]|nr:Hsp20/alpha crystallin family protein [Magnetococcales bacterium]MBF0436530.1 Hsp20/alpha crystallin family protein [Magnetococcales bacterium]